MARGPTVLARRFRDDGRGVSIVEFAIVFPILLMLMLGGIQVITYVNATRKVELVAQSISQMISQAVPPQGSTIATVNATDLHFSFDAALVLFPYVMKDAQRQGLLWWQDILINYTSVAFSQKSAGCTNSADMSACYNANVVWTSTGTYGGNKRLCSTPLQPADNTAAPSTGTLPRSVYGPGSLIVIDVVFTFKPTFGAKFFPASQIARSVYVQPRYADLINYDTTNNDGIGSKCPGY
ncbi:pilus assembly protein [Methylobacterium sp. WL103]|nr:pilus assembly protein [Methylobacterium sp. WL12]TXN03513.1 pilus assembly protein [Methylobacterium sp. WL103]